MTHYIGMDAHSQTCTCVVVDKTGREILIRQIKTTESELLAFIRSIKSKGKVALTFEECGISKWLHLLLYGEVDELIVCNPSYVSRRSGAKNDPADARHLAQQLRGGFLCAVFHEDNFFSDLRNIVSRYDDLVRDTVRLKNQYKALFRAEAKPTVGKGFFRDPDQITQLKSQTGQFVALGLFEHLKTAANEKKRYQKYFLENIGIHSQIQALATIPGISEVRANIIAAIVCSPGRFATKYKFWSYCKLVRQDKQSDGRSYGKVTLPGNSMLKNVFMGAAESAIKHDCDLRQYYDSMMAKGLPHKAAKKNVARKIAAISLALMKSSKVYKEFKWEKLSQNARLKMEA